MIMQFASAGQRSGAAQKGGQPTLGGSAMSVTVIIRFPVSDVAKAVEGMRAHASLLEKITESNKNSGNVHHRVLTGDGELVVLDEWETAEQFQSFFEGSSDVQQVISELGVAGPPTVSVFSSVDVPGTF